MELKRVDGMYDVKWRESNFPVVCKFADMFFGRGVHIFTHLCRVLGFSEFL